MYFLCSFIFIQTQTQEFFRPIISLQEKLDHSNFKEQPLRILGIHKLREMTPEAWSAVGRACHEEAGSETLLLYMCWPRKRKHNSREKVSPGKEIWPPKNSFRHIRRLYKSIDWSGMPCRGLEPSHWVKLPEKLNILLWRPLNLKLHTA